MLKSQELREKRRALVEEARKINDKATAEKRELTAEENVNFDKAMADADAVKANIARAEKLEAEERELGQSLNPHPAIKGVDPSAPAAKAGEGRTKEVATAQMAAFRKFIGGGVNALNEGERRALQADVDTAGGFTVPPIEFTTSLIKAVDDLVFIRQFAMKETVTSAAKYGIPTLDADPADSDWTSELGTGNADSTMAFGSRELEPHPLAKRILVSNKLLRASALNIEALVMQRLAYKFAITEEKAFLTGTGAGQPLGVFTASVDGIPTSRDVSTGNTSTAVTFDGLIEAQYAIKGAYWPRSRWIFNRSVIKTIRKLKDGQGQYLWQPAVTAGTPDTILNMPVHSSEYAPSTMTTGLYVGILGDFSMYQIVDALSMTVQRLNELYALTNQTGFIGRLETDGMPILSEAFARVTLA